MHLKDRQVEGAAVLRRGQPDPVAEHVVPAELKRFG
jgi:hypothetical protein